MQSVKIQRVTTNFLANSYFAFVPRLYAAYGRTSVTRFYVSIVTLFKGGREDTVTTGTPTDIWGIYHTTIASIARHDRAILTSWRSGITFILMKIKVVPADF
jgi:hypothetical protein